MDRRQFLGVGLSLAALPVLGCGPAALSPGLHQAVGPETAPRARLRDLGIRIGSLTPGPHNAITDVPGVAVGHITLIRGDGPLKVGHGPVRTGVTAVLAHQGDLSREPVFAADLTLNGNGEFTGLGPLRRTGRLGAPILLTDTESIGPVYDGAMGYLLELNPELFSGPFRPEPVVGETWAIFLHDAAGRHVLPEHAVDAIRNARPGPVAEGSVGGGTGMRAYRFKAGIGTASRVADASGTRYTTGVLVQANHGARSHLTVQGVPVGVEIADLLLEEGGGDNGKSLLAVIATDAPLLPVQLQALCKRAIMGMARTGAISTHSSGDLMVAFSTAHRLPPSTELHHIDVVYSGIDAIYQSVVEATEEAILNSLTAASTMVGRDGNRIHALPLDRFVAVMRRYGRLK
jgi:D-aminopeptidase